ncbi:hypothetical protein [Candidatus Phytoplasma fraxini]|uniref:Uncharacterized protein n=1 Tax=Ash yellows phytoplasma TaxID=35780 RepID=A0ABZ2U7U0_ASHYP
MNFFKKYWIVILIIFVFIVGIALLGINKLNKNPQNKDSEDAILNNLDFLPSQDKMKIKQKRKEIKELEKEFSNLIQQCKITKNFDPSKPIKNEDKLGTILFLKQQRLNSLIYNFELPYIFEGVDITKEHLKLMITTDNFFEREILDLRKNIYELKQETAPPKPKIQITQEKYDKIKSYILSENENAFLTLNLPEEEKTIIDKIKNSWKLSLSFLNKEQKLIDEYQKNAMIIINK